MAMGTFDIHEEGIWGFHELLELVHILFMFWVLVKKIDLHYSILSNKLLIYLIIE
jgi:hypothetical protein